MKNQMRILLMVGLSMSMVVLSYVTVFAQEGITVCGELNVPPYSYVENGQLKGIDTDIISEALHRMNVEVTTKLYQSQ